MFTAVCMAEGPPGGRGEGEVNLMGRWGSLLLLLALCAALCPGAPASGGWGERELSESGRFVFARFRGR